MNAKYKYTRTFLICSSAILVSFGLLGSLAWLLTVAAPGVSAAPLAPSAPPLPGWIDVLPGPAGSIPTFLTVAGANLFYIADDGVHGRELWKTDSTGTSSLVKDIATAPNEQLAPSSLAEYSGKLYFSGNDGTTGEELWTSDGTITGTVMLKDINTHPSGESHPTRLKSIGGLLYFQATDGTSGEEPWISDGTYTNTVMLKDIYTGTVGSSPTFFTDVNGSAFFIASDGAHGFELWKSNGILAGTQMVKDINPGPGNAGLADLVSTGSLLYFRANDTELWRSDGTDAGTYVVKAFTPVPPPAPPLPSLSLLGQANGEVYLNAFDTAHGFELWKSDGTGLGTVLVADIFPGVDNSNPNNWASIGGENFFTAFTTTSGRELWKTDGTGPGTQLVADINPGTPFSTPLWLTAVNGTLFFQAKDAAHGAELWKSNGTPPTTLLVGDIYIGSTSSAPEQLIVFADRLYFTATDADHGKELWQLDLASSVTTPTVDAGGPYSGTEGSPVALSGTATDDTLVVSTLWMASDSRCSFSAPASLTTNLTCPDNGTVTATLQATNWWGVVGTDSAQVPINNSPPVITSLTFSPVPPLVNSSVTATVHFSDLGSLDTHTATIDWGDGAILPMTVDAATHTATASHNYTQGGAFSLTVTLDDDDGGSVTQQAQINLLRGVFLPLIHR